MRGLFHFDDFCERLEQLTDLEAVQDAYIAYLAAMHPHCHVARTPPNLASSELPLSIRTDTWLDTVCVTRDQDSFYDELLLITAPRGTLNPSLPEWLILPRQAVNSRMDYLSADHGENLDQTAFYQELHRLTQRVPAPFTVVLTAMDNVSGLAGVLKSALPKECRVYEFTDSHLATIVYSATDLRVPWLLRQSLKALDQTLFNLGETGSRSSVAAFPTDAPDRARLLQRLQQGLQDLRRLNELSSTRPKSVLFASPVAATDSGDTNDGTAGRAARRGGPTPVLRGGAARKLGQR